MTEKEIENVLDWCAANRENSEAKITISAPDLHLIMRKVSYVQFKIDKKSFTDTMRNLGFDVIDEEDEERAQA